MPGQALERIGAPELRAELEAGQAEIVAMSTDVAEVVGAALGLNLLFGIPLFPAALIAGAGAFTILALQQMGFRRLEAAISGLVGVIVGKLNAELTARTTGETPQNANFGIKNVALAAFLRGASVEYARPPLLGSLLDRSPEDLAQEARKASRRIECAP